MSVQTLYTCRNFLDTKVLRWLVFFSLFSSNLLYASEQKKNTKPTICSITTNSEDELNVFKKVLGKKDDFSFVELTNLEPNSNSSRKDWLEYACEQGIQCDSLVISGHFAGTFFGNKGFTLPIETLERSSCSSKCDGIIKRPKEVYLFGCMTLNGKDKIAQTPEQFHQSLLRGGFTSYDAERLVGYRYSPLGNSFAARMSKIFSGAYRIFGFNAIAPSGKNITPLLESYLAPLAQNYQFQLTDSSSRYSQLFLNHLKVTTATWDKGTKESIPACFLTFDEDHDSSITKQIDWMRAALANSQQSLSIIPAIMEFADKIDYALESPGASLRTSELNSFFQELGRSTEVFARLSKLTEKLVPGMERVQFDIARFLKRATYFTEEKYSQTTTVLLRALINDDVRTLNRTKVDTVCSLNIQIKTLEDECLSEQRFNNVLYLEMLGCLKPENPSVQKKLTSILLNLQKTNSLRAQAVKTLMTFPHLTDQAKTAVLDSIGKNEKSEEVRVAAIQYVSQSDAIRTKFAKALKNIFLDVEESMQIRMFSIMALIPSKNYDPEFELKAVKSYLSDFQKYAQDLTMKELMSRVLNPRSSESLNLLVDALLGAPRNTGVFNEHQLPADLAVILWFTKYSNESVIRKLVNAVVENHAHSYFAGIALQGARPKDFRLVVPLVDLLFKGDLGWSKQRQISEALRAACSETYVPEIVDPILTLKNSNSDFYWAHELKKNAKKNN